MNNLIIGFVGMTHLGINSAVATAEKGCKVICFDEDPAIINQLERQEPPVVEPQLSQLLAKNIEQLNFTSRLEDLLSCDVVYIANDVPTDEKGQSDLSGIERLIRGISHYLNAKAIMVILAQVPPGFTRQISFPKERLYYQVETLIFGRAIDRALNPERFIIGCSDPEVPLPVCYFELLKKFQCPILPMRYESAELTKIAINCCLVASIGVANTLSEICEKIGANWSEISPALKLDKRIGQFSYLTPGLGIAGGNLERDLTTVLQLSARHGTESSIVESWLKNSRYRRDWVIRVLFQELLTKKQDALIAVLGLAYKENTNSIKNSPSLDLLKWLVPYSVKVYDPVVSPTVALHAVGANNVWETMEKADVLIIMTPWEEFKTLEPQLIKNTMRGRLVIDPYQVLNGRVMKEAGFDYFYLGAPYVSCIGV